MKQTIEVILAKTVIAINSGSQIDHNLIIDNLDQFDDVQQKIELCNAIIVPHCRRYACCYTEEQKALEIASMLSDYRLVFNNKALLFISEALLLSAFNLVQNRDFTSVTFKNTCIEIIEHLRDCDVVEIKQGLMLRIISIIIRGSLYGSEPYDTILAECTSQLDTISTQYGDINLVRFLE